MFHRASVSLKCLLAPLAALLVASASPAPAQTITYTPTKHSVYQAVLDNGSNAWTFPNYGDGETRPISMTGVVINNPWDMLNYTYNSVSNPQPQWQVYIQATEQDDFGGTALYMRIDNPWNPSAPSYTSEAWAAEVQRIHGDSLQRGDLITVTANAPGMFYKGKSNINEVHNSDPKYDFSIEVTGHDESLLKAATITLDDLRSNNTTFIFDASRNTGCEHYQGSLVHLDNLVLDSGTWGLNSTVTVRQGDLTFPMLLGLDPALASITASDLSVPFGVTAILDQESADTKAGYRLWLTNAADVTLGVPEPGTLVLMLLGGVLGILAIRRRNAYSAK